MHGYAFRELSKGTLIQVKYMCGYIAELNKKLLLYALAITQL